jgi:hypothetical protein
MVLLNANHIDRNKDVIDSNHNIIAKKYHNTPVISTCKNHAISDVLPKSLIMVGFNSIPTIKSSKAIPKFPND